jgi:hypothetical protein
MPAPLVAASLAARLIARQLAEKSAKKAVTKVAKKSVSKALKTSKKSKPLAEPKSAVRVKYNKQAMENAIKDGQLKTKRPNMSASRPIVSRPGSGRAIKINTDPTKPKGVFGPLKKKIAAKSPEGRANAKANARGLKAANKKVSDKNSGFGGPTVSAIIKRAEPARANRTRLGKNAFKSK